MHVLKTYPDLVDEAIDSTPEYATHLMEKLEKQPGPAMITAAECGELLSGEHSLSERSYKNTRRILQSKNVHLVTYDSAHIGESNADCTQCFTLHLKDTLQRVVCVSELFDYRKFRTPDQQQHLFAQLQQRRPDIYANFDATYRTTFF